MVNITNNNKKGILLFIVLMTIFVVIILGSIVLSIMSSQSRLTHHQLSRIQAYYAAMAGINLAYERLRNGNDANWPPPPAGRCYTRTICRNVTAAPGCGAAGVIIDPAFPASILNIVITVADRGVTCSPLTQACNPPLGVNICVSATTDYSYTP
jgi:Tfp pilus assembly protein PilX